MDYTCPRCGNAANADFYGPCANCSGELRAQYAGAARDVDEVEYEPKMNVTPNAVASKE